MKKIFLTFLAFATFSTQVMASPDLICSMLNLKRVISIAEKHSNFDKNRHCSVSCMLALKCNDNEVLMVGLLKEVKDFFGPGECSEEDFKADAFGVSLVSKRAARTDSQCLSQCDLYYKP
jgi:glutaredoxin-related protein